MSASDRHIACQIAAAGSWSGEILDRVTLDYDRRFRRRILLTCDGGTEVLLDLASAQVLGDGDALVTASGQLIGVRAARERLLTVRARDPLQLMRIAWHLGNRHLPTEIRGDHLRIRADHVIAGMLRDLGAELEPVDAPFDPEGGAYAMGHGHDRQHDH